MRYFVTILAVIFIVVVIIVLIAKGGGNGRPITYPNLTNYSNSGSSVSQIVTGILTGEEQRQSFEITITQSSRSINIFSGYELTVANTESFSNTPAAYNVFLQGLQNAGFSKSRTTNQTNIFAVCPLGDTFQYILNSPNKTVSNLWSTSCKLSDGNFNGQGQLIRTLFQLQIPNFRVFTQNLPNIPNSYTTLSL
jgi:hypothetical protein